MDAPLPPLLSWPLGALDERGRIDYARDDRSVREVMLNILLTRPGERVMRPQFGAGLLDFVHLPNNETTRQLLARAARKALEQWEPRVVIDEVAVMADPVNLADVHMNISYTLRQTAQAGTLGLTLALGA
ncbi:MAG TPA: GPW/gp25 family protein [Gammaproteobacteria bacterium]|nr:GPW/gp25 family protein [Gammaproteobacteria bacterium]